MWIGDVPSGGSSKCKGKSWKGVCAGEGTEKRPRWWKDAEQGREAGKARVTVFLLSQVEDFGFYPNSITIRSDTCF